MNQTRKRSSIWLHFSRIKEKAQCKYCTSNLSIQGASTNNLHRHLRTQHPTVQVAKLRRQRANGDGDENKDHGASAETTSTPGIPMPLSALRLLVPPIRFVSAVMWHTVQQKVVADYGMLEEFVSMVTDIVPKLLTPLQRAQLLLGLRARLILELCQSEASAELVHPHLDRVQTLSEAWAMEVGGANMEVPHSGFVNLVEDLLKDPDERKNFFQNIFPEEFGPTYDEALQNLMGMFLSRLEKFLPLHSFQQVASMFGEVSPVLEECMDTVYQREEFKTLLHHQKDCSQMDRNEGSLDRTCIISALKLSTVESTEMDETQPQTSILGNEPSCTSDLESESSTLPHMVTEDPTSQIQVEECDWSPGGNDGTAALLADITKHEESIGLLRNKVQDASHRLKQCRVQLKMLDPPSSLTCRPVRQNRGLRMKEILSEEKRALGEEGRPTSRKAKPSNQDLSGVSDNADSSVVKESYMAPITDCSDDSYSHYSDEDTSYKTMSSSSSDDDSWSNYSEDECSSVNSRSNEDPSCSPRNGAGNVPAASRKQGSSNAKTHTPKKPRQVQCLICEEHLTTSIRAHMKTHFPSGDYACPRCDSRFKLYSSLRLHLKRTCFEYCQQQVDLEQLDESKNLYTCDECEKAFRYKMALERHKQTHNELYCSVCRKVLRDAATLARHKVSHTLFQCNRCEESFTVFKTLLRHYQNIHKISRPFQCYHCQKTLTKLRILIAHEWKHTGNLPYQCAKCGLRCKSDADLMSHERVHTREKPFLCAECGKTFAQKSNLLRHLNLIHSESRNEKKHPCSQCEKSFKERGALKKHQRSKHLHELFRHPCPYCGKMLSASTIARHKLIHTGERPFKCTMPDCDKNFRSTSEVRKHVLIQHSTERPYKCDICGKGFIKMCFLKAHAKIHSGEKPFVCNICRKAFPKLYSMQRHKRLVHTFVSE